MSEQSRPLTDCPVVEDPLTSRVPPRASTRCTETNMIIDSGRTTLRPGTYCGGMGITADAEVTFLPGIYIFKNGPLVIGGKSQVSGTDVGLYFTGLNAVMEIVDMANVSLEAPRTGQMAGLLVMQDPSTVYVDDGNGAAYGGNWGDVDWPNWDPSFWQHYSDFLNGFEWDRDQSVEDNLATAAATVDWSALRGLGSGNSRWGRSATSADPAPTTQPAAEPEPEPDLSATNEWTEWGEWPVALNDFRITSDFAHNLLGTIYLPKGDLVIDATQDVAAASDYTAIVVQRLIIDQAPNLVLNAGYENTDVPVPEGLGPVSAEVRLSN